MQSRSSGGRGMANPFASARDEGDMNLLEGSLLFDREGGLPGRLGNEEQGIDARDQANLVPGGLIEPAPGVLGAGGSQALVRFEARRAAAAAGATVGTSGQFFF